MAVPVIMPRQGQSVESCIISKWHKKKDERIEAGDLLFSYETDKASFDEEAKLSGIILDIFFGEGEDVPCLTNVCVIGNTGEDAGEFDMRAVKSAAPTEAVKVGGQDKAELEAFETVQNTPVSPGDGERIRISPRAKAMAERSGVDYRYAQASGPNGRIIERDIAALKESGPVFTQAAAQAARQDDVAQVAGTGIGGRITTGDFEAKGVAAPQQAYEEVKLSNMRKVIAKAMHQSLSTTAQLTLHTSFDATQILEFRKKIKGSKDALGMEDITLNDMILFAASRTLTAHKALNAHFLEDRILYFRNVHLGLAVDTERGLMVPVVFDADTKSLNEISGEVKKMAKDCQSGAINPDLLKGGSFTVTNLGTLDIESFTPVLNPPQTGILGVNTITQRAKEVDGEMVFYPAMGLSLTFDHRALDGAPAARFLKDLKVKLENFSALLAK